MPAISVNTQINNIGLKVDLRMLAVLTFEYFALKTFKLRFYYKLATCCAEYNGFVHPTVFYNT